MGWTTAFKFWALRQSFWLVTGIAAAILLYIVALSVFHGPDDWQDLFDFFEEIAFKTRLGIIEAQVAYQMLEARLCAPSRRLGRR